MSKTFITASDLIKKFDLKPHPEGGYFKETYRSEGFIQKEALPSKFKGNRNYSTAIYFLLPKGSKSSFHRIHSDEIWHFYLGGPLKLVILGDKIEEIVLGQDVQKEQHIQYVVPAGCWFGAYPEMDYTLLKIKRLILEGLYKFTDKAEIEMYVTGINKADVIESILNAYEIDKVMRSISHGKTHRDEKVYVIRGLTYDNVLIYTKGTIKKFEDKNILYILISAKKEGIV